MSPVSCLRDCSSPAADLARLESIDTDLRTTGLLIKDFGGTDLGMVGLETADLGIVDVGKSSLRTTLPFSSLHLLLFPAADVELWTWASLGSDSAAEAVPTLPTLELAVPLPDV